MSMQIVNSSDGTGLSLEQINQLRQTLGVKKEDLEAIKEKFEDKEIKTPDGLKHLLKSFNKYDEDKDGLLNITELTTYSKDKEIGLAVGPASIIGDGEGTTIEQLSLMRDMAEDAKFENKALSKLVSDFNKYDADGDGRITNEEYISFANKNEIQTDMVSANKNVIEQNLFMRAVTNYAKNEESTVGLITSLFVAEA